MKRIKFNPKTIKIYVITALFTITIIATSTVGSMVAQHQMIKEFQPQLEKIYDYGYIQGFRKARSYEIKDTAVLNHLYPDGYFMEKYGNKK